MFPFLIDLILDVHFWMEKYMLQEEEYILIL